MLVSIAMPGGTQRGCADGAHAEDRRFVHFIEARGGGVFLRAAPINVADVVRETVLGGRTGTVLTSATLTVESSFAYVLGRLGRPTPRHRSSEFDFREQAILYPAEMPEPRSPEFNRAAAREITTARSPEGAPSCSSRPMRP